VFESITILKALIHSYLMRFRNSSKDVLVKEGYYKINKILWKLYTWRH